MSDECEWTWETFQAMTTEEKLIMVRARLEWLVIAGLAPTSRSGDGVSVENDIKALERLRDYLSAQLVEENGSWMVQNRIKRGGWMWY